MKVLRVDGLYKYETNKQRVIDDFLLIVSEKAVFYRHWHTGTYT